MKKISNKTDYEDALFYNVINAALKTLFVSPVAEGISAVKDTRNSEKIKSAEIITHKSQPVVAVANGVVFGIDSNFLTIEHEQGIFSSYFNLSSDKKFRIDKMIETAG